MPETIGYYFSPLSGYAYIGHQAFVDLAKDAGREVGYYPVDIAQVFMAANTTPPFKQSDARKSYRAEDMARYAQHYDLPINPKPRFWPTDSMLACKAIVASHHLGPDQSVVSGAILRGVWVADIDISNPVSLSQILDANLLPGQNILKACDDLQVCQDLERFTRTAIEINIFGSPTYVIGTERYWGQDRLPLLRTRLLA
ncbi:MAG: 2-hydroxychromene-2-carboxylate isomerase [Granulosicoccus sp.]